MNVVEGGGLSGSRRLDLAGSVIPSGSGGGALSSLHSIVILCLGVSKPPSLSCPSLSHLSASELSMLSPVVDLSSKVHSTRLWLAELWCPAVGKSLYGKAVGLGGRKLLVRYQDGILALQKHLSAGASASSVSRVTRAAEQLYRVCLRGLEKVRCGGGTGMLIDRVEALRVPGGDKEEVNTFMNTFIHMYAYIIVFSNAPFLPTSERLGRSPPLAPHSPPLQPDKVPADDGVPPRPARGVLHIAGRRRLPWA